MHRAFGTEADLAVSVASVIGFRIASFSGLGHGPCKPYQAALLLIDHNATYFS